MGRDRLSSVTSQISAPLTARSVHLCVDMQNLFAAGSEWHAPWIERVLPVVERIASARPAQTIFTRFIPPRHPNEATGLWRRYYERWRSMTLDRLPVQAIELLPPLARLAPPAEVIDKSVYSAWFDGVLEARLRARGADAVVVTGTETDVCVLAAVLGAIDRGYRVLVPSDAICSSSDEGHNALLELFYRRFSQQLEVVETSEELLRNWR